MPTPLQEQYQESLKKIDAIKKENGDDLGKYSETALKTYRESLDVADGLWSKVQLEDKEAKLRQASQMSAGSFVASSFVGDVPPGEGELPGISQNAKGELYAMDGAYKGLAEAKLATLKSGGYKDAFAQYVRKQGKTEALKGESMKILSEGSDPTGGFWVPPDFRPDLVKKMAVMASIRPNASVYTTGSDHIRFPSVNYNGSTVDDTYANIFTSGVRFSWRGALGSTSDFAEATNPIAGEINIPVQLGTAAIVLTREQTEDNAFDVLGYINDLMAEAFTMGEEYAFTLGSGAGQPTGFLLHPSNVGSTGNVIQYSTYATRQGSTYWGNVVYSGSTTIGWGTATTGIVGVEAQLPPQYEYNAKWFGAKATYSAIRAINSTTASLPQWSLGESWPNYANGYNASLLGYSILKNQFMSSPATGVTSLALGDMSGYYIIDRVGISVDVFREVYGLRDQVVVYARKRVGGQLVHYWKMKVMAST